MRDSARLGRSDVTIPTAWNLTQLVIGTLLRRGPPVAQKLWRDKRYLIPLAKSGFLCDGREFS